MKQIFAISFILALIIPFSGTFMWLTHQKKMVRKEVKHMMIEGVNLEDLVSFTFTEYQVKNELNWEHSKEFTYKGKMYDIVTSSIENGKYIYVCWLDKAETKLNNQLATLFGQRWSKEKDKYHSNINLDHFVDSLFIEEILESQFCGSFQENQFSDLQIELTASEINRFYPPPELKLLN